MWWSWFRRRGSSIRLALEFEDDLDVQLFVQGVGSRVVRLTARVRFRTQGRWSELFPAIIDTGSPDSIVPYSIWSAVDHRVLLSRPVPLTGIGGGARSATFGEVTLAVDDSVQASPAILMRGCLLSDDSEPLLLGFQDFLTQAVLHCDYPNRIAYLEFARAG